MFQKRTQKLLMMIAAVVLSFTNIAIAANALNVVNAKRASLGLYALNPDASLQAHAEWSAQTRANRRITGHLGQMHPNSAEGVGYGYQEFRTCYHKSPGNNKPPYTRTHQYAGAAVAYDSSGRPYYTLVLSGQPADNKRSAVRVSRDGFFVQSSRPRAKQFSTQRFVRRKIGSRFRRK